MPQRIKESLNAIKDILTVCSVLISIGSVAASAIAWVAVNVFYPESIGIEVTKYLLIILVSVTVSTIMLQAHKRKVEYILRVFAIQCPNCREWIKIPIPAHIVKDIHPVDGPPTGKFGAGRELQVICMACGQVYHIVYP